MIVYGWLVIIGMFGLMAVSCRPSSAVDDQINDLKARLAENADSVKEGLAQPDTATALHLARTYELTVRKAPRGPGAAEMLFHAAKLRDEYCNDPRYAAFLYRTVFKDYPKSPFAADALFKEATMYVNPILNDEKRALETFKHFVNTYPNDKRVPLAEEFIQGLTLTDAELKARLKSIQSQ